MDKTTIMLLGTILKFVIALVGMGAALVTLTRGFAKKDNRIVKKGGFMFFGTCVLLLVLGAIEFVILANV